MQHRPKPHDHPHFDAPIDNTKAQLSTADPNATHPVAGVPTDAPSFLVFLRAGVFTDAQLAYLRAALPVFSAAVDGARGRISPAETTAADEILAVWRPIVQANPAPAGDPFKL